MSSANISANADGAPLRATLVYDGDCGFCSRSVEQLRRLRLGADIVTWQEADLARLGLSEPQVIEAVQWVAPSGAVSSGHAAIAAALRDVGGIWVVPAWLITAAGVSRLSRRVYRWIAENRYRLRGATGACAAHAPAPYLPA